MLNGWPAGGVWLSTQATDMRKSFDGLSALVRNHLRDGIVTLINGHAANWHRTQTHAATVTVCHRPIAWLRNWRNVLREIRWRWTLKVL